MLAVEFEGVESLPDFHDVTAPEIAWISILISPLVGSFLGLLIVRLPAGRPIAVGRSQCDACATTLRPLDLIPVLSWAFLRGRCRHCNAKLSAFYPLVELAALAIAVWSALETSGWRDLTSCVVGWELLVAGVIAWRKRRSLWIPTITLMVWLAWLYVPILIQR